MIVTNLNELKIQGDQYEPDRMISDSPAISRDRMVQVFFRDLELHLLRLIDEAEVVIGCVAWLTSDTILKALAKKAGVSIIVQKEDFLRPDLNPRDGWRLHLRRQYAALPSMYRFNIPGLVYSLSTFSDNTLDAVRCVGNYNSRKAPAFPRAHHKFVLFCRLEDIDDGGGYIDRSAIPYAVWTGSYNFTKNAGASLENAVVLRDEHIVYAYYNEYSQVCALSEPLDWETAWSEPEWRIGT